MARSTAKTKTQHRRKREKQAGQSEHAGDPVALTIRETNLAVNVTDYVKSRWRGISLLVGFLTLVFIAPRILGSPGYCKCIFDTWHERPTLERTKLDEASIIYATVFGPDDEDPTHHVSICVGDDGNLCSWGAKYDYYLEERNIEVKGAVYLLSQSLKAGLIEPGEATGVLWKLSLSKRHKFCRLMIANKKGEFEKREYYTEKMSCGNHRLTPGVFDTPLW